MKVIQLALASFLLTISCIAQGPGGPVAVRGANAEVLRWSTKTNTVLVRISNTSSKDITGYVLAVMAVHADGKTDRDERMSDFVLTMVPRAADDQASLVTNKLLHPGESREETLSLTPDPENPVARVNVRVEVAAYVDQTAEAANEAAFGRLQAARRGSLLARRRTAEIITSVLSDPATPHPIANAIAGLQESHIKPRSQQDVSWDSELASVVRDLQSMAERSLERSSTAAPGLREYATRKQKESALLAAHAELRRLP